MTAEPLARSLALLCLAALSQVAATSAPPLPTGTLPNLHGLKMPPLLLSRDPAGAGRRRKAGDSKGTNASSALTPIQISAWSAARLPGKQVTQSSCCPVMISSLLSLPPRATRFEATSWGSLRPPQHNELQLFAWRQLWLCFPSTLHCNWKKTHCAWDCWVMLCAALRGTGRGAETPNELFGLCKICAGSVSSMFIPLSLPPPQGPTIELSISFGHVELHFSQNHLTVLIVQDLQTTSPFLPTCHPCRVLFGDRPSTSASTNTQTEHLHLCVP